MEYIQSKELFKIKENIYKNLYRFYKLNSDCKITFEIVKYIKYKDYYSSDSKILEKFNLTKDYCDRKNIKYKLEYKETLRGDKMVILHMYFNEDKFINEKDFFIKFISVRTFIYIQ